MELTMPFSINDLQTMLVLQRALMEARFFSGARTPDLPGSPPLAALHDQVVSCIADHYQSIGDDRSAANLASWLQWSKREAERDSLVATLARMEGWNSWDRDRQVEIAKSLMMPFTFIEEDVEDVVQRTVAR